MPLSFKKNLAVFSQDIGVEDAELLLSWVQKHAHAQIDLSACTYLHPSSLQVLMAARLQVKAWPTEPVLRQWLQSAIITTQPEKR